MRCLFCNKDAISKLDKDDILRKTLEISTDKKITSENDGVCAKHKFLSEKFCLTCGLTEHECEEGDLEVHTVGQTVSKTALNEKSHNVNDGDKIYMCKFCANEMSI